MQQPATEIFHRLNILAVDGLKEALKGENVYADKSVISERQ
jgi:hypothetical protein